MSFLTTKMGKCLFLSTKMRKCLFLSIKMRKCLFVSTKMRKCLFCQLIWENVFFCPLKWEKCRFLIIKGWKQKVSSLVLDYVHANEKMSQNNVFIYSRDVSCELISNKKMSSGILPCGKLSDWEIVPWETV